MKSLQLGGICSDFQCALCCKNTEMILSHKDIERLVEAGYSKNEFCYVDQEGFHRLRNVDGNCFFLKENKCLVYQLRPQGCRFYPIIFDLDSNKTILDSECPLIDTISQSIVSRFSSDLKKFINSIIQEKNKR